MTRNESDGESGTEGSQSMKWTLKKQGQRK